MYEKLLENLRNEVTTIETAIKERQDQRSELDKALSTTDKELLRLDGRLLEIRAVVAHIEALESEEVTEEVPTTELVDAEYEGDEVSNN